METSLWGVLVTGFLAGGASCAAVQGGLLAGVVARRHPQPVSATPAGKRPPPRATSALEDAVPVGSFLVAKLVTHTLLGALLGLLGNAVQLGVSTRAWVQIAAGVFMVLLALDLLGVKAVRRAVPSPPAAWGRFVRQRGRWSSAFAPAALGGATVLIPCGVTLGMEILAVASGSPLAGAAIMATFVVGTSPMFATIGYAARRSGAVLRGRLSVLAGVAVLVAGIVSVNTGMVLADSPVSITSALRSLTGSGQPDSAQPPVALAPLAPGQVQRVTIKATDDGYSPSTVRVRAGAPTILTLRTDNLFGCTRVFVIPSTGLEEYLPKTGDTAVDLGILKPGRLRFTCAMGMYSGSIEVVA